MKKKTDENLYVVHHWNISSFIIYFTLSTHGGAQQGKGVIKSTLYIGVSDWTQRERKMARVGRFLTDLARSEI